MVDQALLAGMRRQAAEDCQNCLTEAQRQAEETLAEARRQAEDRRAQAIAVPRAEMERLGRQSRMVAEAEAGKAALAMKNSVVEEVFAGTRDALRLVANSPDFAGVAEALLEAAIEDIEGPAGRAGRDAGGPATVLAPPQYVECCTRWLQSHGYHTANVEPSGEVWDGVAVQDQRKTMRVTNTLSSRFAKLESVARKQCMIALFGGGR